MGIDSNGARFLAYAKTLDVDFVQTAMIGRQNLYINPLKLRQVLEQFGYGPTDQEVAGIFGRSDGFSEAFFHYLGAQQVHSFDYSAYQNSTYIHDMNEVISDEFKECYSVVLDGGSLEHIFNFPVAIKNCMEMVKVGGHYLAITPANNFFGHGFYQFSPELYFTVFSEVNGFKLEKMIAFEEKGDPTWYSVKSPFEISGRVTLSNSFPVHLLVIAKRLDRRPIFQTSPQQSDYVSIWSSSELASAPAKVESVAANIQKRPIHMRFAKALVPASVRRVIRKALDRSTRKPDFDPRFFIPMD